MLRKSYILSIIVITTLLVIQSIWIVLLIDFERKSFDKQFEIELKKAIANELRIRRNSKTKNRAIDFILLDKKDYEKNQLYPNHTRYKVDSKDVGENDLFSLNVEHIYQAVLRKTNPLKLNILSQTLTKYLDSLNASADYILEYSDVDTMKSYSNIKTKIHFGGSYKTFEYLSATKDMKLSVLVYYPFSVYKGNFLLISATSLFLLGFIFYSLIAQIKMLANQISNSQIKENLTNFFTHELRSPLQSALTGVEMIENCSSKKDYNKLLSYLIITKEKLYSINNLIDKVLEINKLKKNKARLHREGFILSEIIEIQANNCLFNKEKEILFDVDTSCKIKIYADKLHLSNAVYNLFKNSITYSKDSVIIKVKVNKDDKFTSIIVDDNGIGISYSHQKKIFDQFYRINDESQGHRITGFGLGLNYVKWVAEEHNGKVTVESTEGKGSKFTLYIKEL